MKSIIMLLCVLAAFTSTIAQPADARKQQFNLDKSGLAIQGYDPVAYFNGKPAEGDKNITVFHNGVTYRFATTQNRDAFKQNPQQYEPQYGGWCAYAMGAKGEKVEVDPETYKLLDGKLYLFYNKFFNNTLKTWNKNEMQLKNNADKNWTKFIH